jgi:oligo-1,6-glucosidase
MDSINVISKNPEFPDAPIIDPNQTYHWGGIHFFNGPNFLKYMKELKNNILDKFNIFVVGETPGVTVENAEIYTDEFNGIFNMIFHFELVGMDKWDNSTWKLQNMKEIMSRWQTKLIKGWNSLYLENHDQPRSVSRFTNDKEFRSESAKMLATWLFMMKGTPYIYQGEELGMTNVKFDSIEDYRDIETINFYNDEIKKKINVNQIMEKIHNKSRDNSRTPMQWNNQENAGFTKPGIKTWIKINPNFKEINVENQLKDFNSVFHYYKKLIELRKKIFNYYLWK